MSSMAYARTASPSKECSHCGTSSTPLWRKVNNRVVCNACGLYFKKHGEFPRSRSRASVSSAGFSHVPASPQDPPRHPELTKLIMAAHEPTLAQDRRSPVLRLVGPKRASVQRRQHQVLVRKVSSMLPPVRQYIPLPSPASQPPPTGLTPAPGLARDFEPMPMPQFDLSKFLNTEADVVDSVTLTPTNVFPETEVAWPWLSQPEQQPEQQPAEPAYAVPASPTFSVSTTGESACDVADPASKSSFCLDDILADVRVGSPSVSTFSVPDCDPVDQFLSLDAY